MKTLKMVLFMVMVAGFMACAGGGDNPPVFNDQGECVANCPTDDVVGGDFLPDANDNGLPEAVHDIPPAPDNGPDMGQYTCPAAEPIDLCKPKKALDAICFDYGEGSKFCSGGWADSKPCSTDADCQKAPSSEYPPCVCWDVCWVNYDFEYGWWFCNPDLPVNEKKWTIGKLGLQDGGTECKISFVTPYNNGEAEPMPDLPAFYHTPGENWNVFYTPSETSPDYTLTRLPGSPERLEVKDGAGNHLLWCWYADEGHGPEPW